MEINNLANTMKTQGIINDARSNAEAINMLIDSFLLKSDLAVPFQIEENPENHEENKAQVKP